MGYLRKRALPPIESHTQRDSDVVQLVTSIAACLPGESEVGLQSRMHKSPNVPLCQILSWEVFSISPQPSSPGLVFTSIHRFFTPLK